MYKLPIESLDLNRIDIFEQLVNATESLGILKGTLNKLPNPNIILNVITLKEAKESSEIENIITTYDELYKEMILKDKSNPNAKEVLNYRSAINLGNRLVQEKNMITTNMINEIHHLIEPNKGDIRKQKGTVIMNTKTGEILHTPPQTYEEIMEYLKNLEEFINLENKVNPLIKMALIHLQFEMIHPYYNGNGRTGRVLNLMYLKLSDKLDIPILYLSKYIIENRNEYYNLLNRAGKSEENILEFIIYMLKAIEKAGLRADICAGLSLGEYEALYLSGAISAADAIAIVDKRGQYMSEIKGGAMSAVLSLSNDTIKSIVDDIEGCWVANYNCPGQTVISGTTEAIALAGEKLKEAGAKRVLPLKVSGAFHSGLMKEAGEKLGKVLDTVKINDIQIPYVANINAEIVTDKNDIRKNLIDQVSGSVHLEQSV